MCIFEALVLSGLSNFTPMLLNWAFIHVYLDISYLHKLIKISSFQGKNLHCENIDFFAKKTLKSFLLFNTSASSVGKFESLFPSDYTFIAFHLNNNIIILFQAFNNFVYLKTIFFFFSPLQRPAIVDTLNLVRQKTFYTFSKFYLSRISITLKTDAC